MDGLIDLLERRKQELESNIEHHIAGQEFKLREVAWAAQEVARIQKLLEEINRAIANVAT